MVGFDGVIFLFVTYVKTLISFWQQLQEKLKERERELRKRKEREEQQMERVRSKVRRKEAVASYLALLVETIKSHQVNSWLVDRCCLIFVCVCCVWRCTVGPAGVLYSHVRSASKVTAYRGGGVWLYENQTMTRTTGSRRAYHSFNHSS